MPDADAYARNRRRWRLALIAAGLIAADLAAYFKISDRLELRRLLTQVDSSNPVEGGAAQAELRRLGPKAVSFLARALRPDPPIVEAYHDLLERFNLGGDDELSGIDRQVAAAHALRALGPAAAPAIPNLIANLAPHRSSVERDVQYSVELAAEQTLEALSPQSVPALAAALQGTNIETRLAAIKILSDVGPAALPAVPQFIRMLGDSDAQIRAASALALGDFKTASEAVRPLARALHDSHRRVRLNAAAALSGFGAAAAPAVPDLVTNLRDPSSLIRFSAAKALAHIGPAAAEAGPVARTLLDDPAPIIRAAAAMVLGRIGPASAPAVPDLISAFGRESDPNVRIGIVMSLGQIGPGAAAAVPALAGALKGDPIPLRAAAADALGRIGPAARSAIPALIEALNNDPSGVGRSVLRALGQIDPQLARHLEER